MDQISLNDDIDMDRKRRRLYILNIHHLTTRNLYQETLLRDMCRENHRNREYGLNILRTMSDSNFKRMFRLNRLVFYELLSHLDIEPSSKGKINSQNCSGSFICGETRLAVTLRWLAGGSHHDIAHLFGVSVDNFFQANGVLWPTIEAIDQYLKIEFPTNEPELQNIANGFAKYTLPCFNGCIMAVDGIIIRTRCPYLSEVENTQVYFNRKHIYGVVVMAGCDADCKFIMFSSTSPGSTHDAMAWLKTSVCKHLFLNNDLDNKYDYKFYAIGDDAFINTCNFLTPIPGRGIGDYKDAYNYYISAMRQCIERAFGILVKRWGILWRPFNFAFERWSVVLQVCAKLHNLCIESRVGNVHIDHLPEDVQIFDRIEVFDGDDHHLDILSLASRIIPDSTRRDNLVSQLEGLGARRPAFAICNSRAN